MFSIITFTRTRCTPISIFRYILFSGLNYTQSQAPYGCQYGRMNKTPKAVTYNSAAWE